MHEPPATLQTFHPAQSRWQQPDEVLLRLGDGMTDEDIAALRREVDRYWVRHLKPVLKAAGLVELVKTEKFNRCSRRENVVDFQFDHPGVLPIGTRFTYHVSVIDLYYDEEIG